MEEKSRRVLLLLYPGLSEFEIVVAIQILSAEFDIVTASADRSEVTGEAGLRMMPDVSYEDVNICDYEALIIPGAKDMECVKDDEPMFALVCAFHKERKVIAAICGGPFILLRAGVLQGKDYTVAFYQEGRAFLGFDESRYVWAPVVESDNILTAQGYAFVDFGLKLGEKLGIALSPRTHNFFWGRHESLERI